MTVMPRADARLRGGRRREQSVSAVNPVVRVIVHVLVIAPLAAAAHLQAFHYRDSMTLWQSAFAGNPGSWLIREHLGEQHQLAGHSGEAIAQYQAALALYPRSASSHNNLGLLLMEQSPENVDAAAAHFREAIRFNAKDGGAHSNLGLALLRMGRIDDATVEQAAAVELEPDDAAIRYNHGAALEQAQRVGEAIDAFEQCLRLDPAYLMARVHLASLHMRQADVLSAAGKFEEAVPVYRRAISIAPARVDGVAAVQNNLGLALANLGKYSEAIAAFSEALQIRPGFTQAESNLAKAEAALRANGKRR